MLDESCDYTESIIHVFQLVSGLRDRSYELPFAAAASFGLGTCEVRTFACEVGTTKESQSPRAKHYKVTMVIAKMYWIKETLNGFSIIQIVLENIASITYAATSSLSPIVYGFFLKFPFNVN